MAKNGFEETQLDNNPDKIVVKSFQNNRLLELLERKMKE